MFDLAYTHRNFPQIRPDWLALREEAVLDPDQRIIDPHHHLWDVPGSRYLMPELLADLRDGHKILATVHVDCKSGYREAGPEALRPVGETEFVVRCAQEGAYAGLQPCAAIVGYADLSLGAAVREVLAAHVVAGKGLFRGIRVRAAWHGDAVFQGPADGPPGDLMEQASFRQGFAHLQEMDLSCDLWVFHTQLADAANLAAAFPEASIVINHVGGPLGIGPFANKRDAVFVDWKRDMMALAKLPNVSVKLGGLAMPRIGFAFDALEIPPSSADLAAAWQPYFETCLAAFGPARCMFESNFPVDKGMSGYRLIWNAFKRVAAHLSAADRDAVFYSTAASFYRIAL